MDEIFHVPQAQKYCQAKFHEWDPKITTFPGLYVSSCLLRGVGLSGMGFCGKDMLRLDNAFFGLGVHAVSYRLLRRRLDPSKAAAQSLMLSLYPIHFFYQLLGFACNVVQMLCLRHAKLLTLELVDVCNVC